MSKINRPNTTSQKSPSEPIGNDMPESILSRMAAAPKLHENSNPLWQGPSGDGENGGVTQSMIIRFLSCRERFRLKYVLGLEPYDKWNHKMGYGNMWHVCEEALSKGCEWEGILDRYCHEQANKYPTQREDIVKWYNVCNIQFPEYVKYWSEHPDVLNRTPLLQEQVFDVPYDLPSGRTIRLRGKWDSVDLIKCHICEGKKCSVRDLKDCPNCHGNWQGIYIQENKTKADIDKLQVERQIKYDLQTNLYLIALSNQPCIPWINFNDPKYSDHASWSDEKTKAMFGKYLISGVRYNVVRRPLSGGKGNISLHSAKYTKTKVTPAETPEHFYERLRSDYIAKEPDYWFFRVKAEISQDDLNVFRKQTLDPILEQMCDWYSYISGANLFPHRHMEAGWGLHHRTPFGVYSSLEEGGATEYDAFLDNSSEAGLRRVTELFSELK